MQGIFVASVAALLAAFAPGQVTPLTPPGQASQGPQSVAAPSQAQPQGGIVPGTMSPAQRVPFGAGGASQTPNEFTSIWSIPSAPKWAGFPAFPSRLQGYGSYPRPFDADGPGVGMAPPLPAAAPEPNGWPSWVRLRVRKPLSYASDVGLLIAQDGRVWHRTRGGEPLVPSSYHDGFATLAAGGLAELRTRGGFEVLLHQSTRLEMRGPSTLRVDKLDPDNVEIAFERLSFVRLRASKRAHKVAMPDGSVLVIPRKAASDAGFSGFAALLGGAGLPASGRGAFIEVHRSDAPSSYAGRATITNYGGDAVFWRHAFGETRIGTGQRVIMFLSQPTTPAPAGLAPGDAMVAREGHQATCRAGSETEVAWSGARFTLPAGAALRLRSLGRPIELSQSGG